MKTKQRPSEEVLLMRPFDDDQRKQYGSEMAELIHEMQGLEDKAASLSKQAAAMKEEIKERNIKVRGIKDNLRSGQHGVYLVCKWSMATNGAGELVWMLTASDGAVERTEATNEADRQGVMSFTPDKN
jgi:hypothetical protein